MLMFWGIARRLNALKVQILCRKKSFENRLIQMKALKRKLSRFKSFTHQPAG